MSRQDLSSRHFQQKISKFCEMRVATVAPENASRKIERYLISLIVHRKAPPRLNGRIDWMEITIATGIDDQWKGEFKREVRIALDAIIRWLGAPPVLEDRQIRALSPRQGYTDQDIPQIKGSSTRKPRRDGEEFAEADFRATSRGPQPKPILEFPEPLFDATNDPGSFQEALVYHMRRFGESYWHLYRAVIRLDETFDHKTLLSWIEGERVPRSVGSMNILARVERRYRLPEGYFKAKLPHQSRSLLGHDLGDISPAERRRIAWHLPDDFGSLPFSKREEIIDWVRRVLISGSTDYRRYQAAASKQRYAIRFPGVTYGGGSLSHRANSLTASANSDPAVTFEDPDLLSGVVDAPPRLAMEMSDLIRFKTSTLTAIGFRRNGVWGEETASQKIEHLGLMFGALAASPTGAVKGCGVSLSQLTFGLLIFPGVWDWYLQWREQRRGFYTRWEEDMLMIAQALSRSEVGWIRQHPELLKHVKPIEGLIAPEEIELALRDWHGACDAFHRHAANRSKEIQRVMRVHRDPFEPIMVVLEADSPLSEYRKITDEILKRMPDEDRYPRAAAEAVRSFLLLRLGLHLGLRQKNLRQLRVCPRGHFPTSERRLEDMKCGELRWSDREHGWEVLIPSVAFKNSGSSFFGQKPFRLILPDLLDLYKYLEAYIDRHRGVLLGPAKDPGTLFVKTVKTTSLDAAYDSTKFYEAWRTVIQRYGIYNPYTGRGAIKGLLPHGPHNLRDILATHILKQTGSYEQASYAIQDTPDVVQQHYGRFLPQDKAALAARILNQVWEAA
ncbi:integrase [Rhizobium aquaticum]|uniref:Integrase n=1 Tax=Rhizobium aquaticum TaxID=1549636 RepID=A0ABV2J5V9_9HYPH